jgi:hypothetical protein
MPGMLPGGFARDKADLVMPGMPQSDGCARGRAAPEKQDYIFFSPVSGSILSFRILQNCSLE